jgi:predicted unusual protein kinase regulating ubiquinone biosynthesis (AarF/ABC1/UbiB family)
VLWGGQDVIVKVKRPGIGDIVEADLSGLRFVVHRLNRWRAIRRRVDLPGVLREFTTTLREELDYFAEAHNAERLGIAFAGNEQVLVPRIYWSHVRQDVITLEYVPGIKITDYDRIEDAGISRSDLAELLLQVYLQQILVDGFFHADPHPGNVFARPGPVLVLVDFGMVGRLTPRMRDNLREVFLGIVTRDFNMVVAALVRLHFVRPGADLAVVRRTVIWTIDTFYEMSMAELRDVDPRDVLEGTYDAFRTESFTIPTNFAFVGRAVGTLSGLCTGLDPAFQFASVARPYANSLIRGNRSATQTLRTIGKESRDLALTVATLPRLAQEVLEGVGDAEWIRRDLTDITRFVLRLERVLRGLLTALLAAAFLISAAFLVHRFDLLSYILFGVTILLIFRVIFSMLALRRPPR